ncbi:MAG: SWIM zinc finger family protein [Candidatus Lokiarchaeota archaeon]
MRRNPYERDYNKRKSKKPKTSFEKKQTHLEVQKIKKDLINYAKTKWGKRWVRSILRFGRPFRMKRGIIYAEEERRISNISINKGEIFATVQGTAPSPYRVRVEFETISEEKWEEILNDISSNLLLIIRLLEGKLPDDIKEIFKKYGISLFPDSTSGFNAKCSCPDQEVPCKHIAAVVLYIARVIDYDPFILLKIRGGTKEELLSWLLLENGKDRERSHVQTKTQKEIDPDFSFNIPTCEIKDLNLEIYNLDNLTINFQFHKPSKLIEALENLGIPPNLENPQKFRIIVKNIYKRITKRTYSLYKSI